MAGENKRIVTCDICKKKDEYNIYSAEDLGKIPESYLVVNLTTPGYDRGMIGFLGTDILICRSCKDDLALKRLGKFSFLLKKLFKKEKLAGVSP